jgi:hypothetical protein
LGSLLRSGDLLKTSANGPEKTVNRHDIGRSFDWLAAAELDVRQSLKTITCKKRGAMVGRWFLPDRLLRKLLSARLGYRQTADTQFLLRLSSFPLRRLFAGLNPLSCRTASLSADAVIFKNHIRAFYFDSGLTLKCSNPLLSTAPEALANEIKVRSGIRDAKTVCVPKLLDYRIGEDRSCFVEKTLTQARMLDTRRDCDRLASGLFEFYLQNGMVQRPLADAVHWPDIAKRAERLFVMFGLDHSGLARFGKRVFCDRDPAQLGIGFGLSHGDMSCGNLLVDNDTIFVIDWERARQAPVFSDFFKLFFQVPGLQARVTMLFDQWSKSQPMQSLEAQDQITLGKITQLTYLSERYEQVLGQPEEGVAAPWFRRSLAEQARVVATHLSQIAA